jgi:selenide,water dikinase
MGPEALAQVLRPLRERFRAEDYPDLLVGLEVSDDAAVYKINDQEHWTIGEVVEGEGIEVV